MAERIRFDPALGKSLIAWHFWDNPYIWYILSNHHHMMQKKQPTEEEIAMTANWGTWRKEPSEFPWAYDVRETCLILEGKATVTARDGQEISFEAGDLVTFEEGLECTWKIEEAIRKRYTFG
jgi:uncharacterized cupin superfamily protein